MKQEITDEEKALEKQLTDNPPGDDLGDDADAVPADQFDHTPKDIELIRDQGGFEAVLDNDLQPLNLNQPAPATGEEV